MANSRKSPGRPRKLAQFPSPDGTEPAAEGAATAVMDPPPDPETPFDAPAPQAAAPPPKPRKAMTFFERVAAIDRKDWPDRAKIKVYRLAPIINRLAGSEFKFITIYDQPLTSEEKIKIDHGSGKYRLYLNYKPPGHKGEAELDSVEIDILDPNFPPNIPNSDWVDDPRNKKWAWAKPAGPQQPAAQVNATDSTLNALDTFITIQDRLKEQMPAAPPAPTAPTTPAVPTMVDQLTIVEKIMAMKADNPMLEIMKQQMADNAKATEAERQRAHESAEKAREREAALQKQLIEAKYGGEQGNKKDILTQIFDLAGDDGKIDKLKKVANLFGLGGSNGNSEPVRAARTTGFDIVREIVNSPFGASFGQSIGQGAGLLFASLANRNAPQTMPGPQNGPQLVRPQQPAQPAPMAGQPSSPGAQPMTEDPIQRLMRIGATITEPMLYQFFLQEKLGDEFAVFVEGMWPADFAFLKEMGPDNIVAAYQQAPAAWAIIAPRAPMFKEFVTEFCNYDPNEDEAPAGPTSRDDGIVDLTAQEAN